MMNSRTCILGELCPSSLFLPCILSGTFSCQEKPIPARLSLHSPNWRLLSVASALGHLRYPGRNF
eukprot:1065035-Rhodomonas_salina.3